MFENENSVEVSSTIELVIFKVSDQYCALTSTEVQEIIKQHDMTKVYNADDYVKGIINLRGGIVSIISLHKKLGIKEDNVDKEYKVILANYKNEIVGLQVDDVEDIMKADSRLIEPPPSNLNGLDSIYFSGIFKMNDKLVSIINLDELLKFESPVL